jgi:arabinan endo-1,5-alpha-L-arabinosidase
MNLRDIRMRDPYVYLENGMYYLYGTTDSNPWHGPAEGFCAYASGDLVTWEPIGPVFSAADCFWGTENFWAPEMHAYRGGYYLFASFKAPGRRRATAVLRADSPRGPFRPWGSEQLTPEAWECLDGTLYTDPCGSPWLIFCHEWVQAGDGEVHAMRLREDLTAASGEPVLLFRASQARWPRDVRHSSGVTGRVTDGPFVYKTRAGLCLLWSSLSASGYAIGTAASNNGITGPWTQAEEPLYSGDGGHGMVFRDKSGALLLAIHTPNNTPDERPVFLPLRETATGLERVCL